MCLADAVGQDAQPIGQEMLQLQHGVLRVERVGFGIGQEVRSVMLRSRLANGFS